jgi:hypothetical protein
VSKAEVLATLNHADAFNPGSFRTAKASEMVVVPRLKISSIGSKAFAREATQVCVASTEDCAHALTFTMAVMSREGKL